MPLTPFSPVSDPLTRMFDMMLGGQGGYTQGNLIRAPETDVVETEDAIRVLMDVPGISRNDIDVEVENNILTVTAERKEQHEEESDQGNYHISERRFGRFSRSFVLPRDVNQDKIQADVNDGVLTVTIPKSEQSRRRRIEIGRHDHGEQNQQGREIPVQSGGQQSPGQQTQGQHGHGQQTHAQQGQGQHGQHQG